MEDVLNDIRGILDETDKDMKDVTTFLELEFDDKLRRCLLHPCFLLMAYEEDKYYISPNIMNKTHADTAHYVMIITLYLYDKVFVYPEFFYDKYDHIFYFGDEAFSKYKDHIGKKRGIKQCSVCERFLPEQMIDDEKGYCKICEEITIPNATFH